MDKGQNKIFQKFKRSHLNISLSLSISSPSSPSQNNPKYLFNEQSRIWRWKAQKSRDEMKAWAKVEWDLPPGSCIIMSYHPEPSTIPIYAHHSDPHENIVNSIFSTGICAKTYQHAVSLVLWSCFSSNQSFWSPCGNYNSGLFWGPGV